MTALPRLTTVGRRHVVTMGDWLSFSYRPRVALRIGLALALIAAVILSILPLGSYEIADDRVWTAIFHPSLAADDEFLIVWQFRVPRILLGALVGAMLAVAGGLIQSLTRNGLADPGLIGITEGATVVILILTITRAEIPYAWYPAFGMIGSAAVATIVLSLTKRLESVRFILIGIGVSAFISAGISLFLTYGEINQVSAVLLWMAGSLGPASWRLIDLLLPWAVVSIGVSLLVARATDIGLLGEQAAAGLGVRTRIVRFTLVAASFALTASVVAAVGPIGFVGLIGPHLARFLVGTNQTALVGGSAVCGAVLVLIADSVGRLIIAPVQIPAGIVMAVLGVPFFLWLLWRRRHEL